MAFKIYTLQRLHVEKFRAVAAAILFPPDMHKCLWALPAQSRSLTLEAMAAPHAMHLPLPLTTNARRRASLPAHEGLECCCPTAYLVQYNDWPYQRGGPPGPESRETLANSARGV